MSKIVGFVAPSSAGKDAILKELVDRKFVQPIISTTSRDIRQGETNGIEYNFVNKETAISMLHRGDFIEHRLYEVQNGSKWIYGVTKGSFDINKDIIYGVILDYQGLKQMEKYLYEIDKEDSLISIYIDVPLQERLRRSINREGTMDDLKCLEVCRRALDDDINVVPAKDNCDYVVNNEGDFWNTINRILDILEA
jgi:guanylate kinase